MEDFLKILFSVPQRAKSMPLSATTQNRSNRSKNFDIFVLNFKTQLIMEVVTIENKCFEELLLLIKALTTKVGLLNGNSKEKTAQGWMDGQEVCFALNISNRTLQTLRDKHIIGYTQMNRKFYYKPEEVCRLLPTIDQYIK